MATAKYKRRKKNKIYPNFRFLPRDLTIIVLSKLPSKAILRVKAVCKDWFDIVTSDPSFAKTHYENNSLALVELGRAWDSYAVLNSCKGFILMRKMHSFVVYNPLTRETFITKHLPTEYLSCIWYNAKTYRCALGFSPVTKQFKIVVLCADVEQGIYRVQIYTIGADSTTDVWRTVFLSKYHSDFIYYFGGEPTELNGFLHWRASKNRILCLDIDKEEFGEMSLPMFPPYIGELGEMSIELFLESKYSYISSIGVYMGLLRLGVSFVDPGNSERMEMWVMKEYGIPESWMRFVVAPLPNHYMNIKCSNSRLVDFLNIGEIIFLLDLGPTISPLLFYNQAKKCYGKLWFSNSCLCKNTKYLYTPSFFSLKNLVAS